MKNRLILVAGLFAILAFACKAQVIGNIYSKAEAKVKFGTVVDSVIFSTDDLRKILTGTENFVMMKIVNGKVIILGDGRKVLSPQDAKVASSDQFFFCSKSKVLELLMLSNSSTLSFELRKFYFTISYGMNTLEDVLICPPFCVFD